MRIEQRISELGLELPPVPMPAANYANAVRTGNLVFLSGTVPTLPDGTIPKGKVGADVTTEEAIEHARSVGLTLLAILREEIGDLDRVRRVVKLLGMVNATPDFREQSRVIMAARICLSRSSASGTPVRRSVSAVCRSGSPSRSRRSSRSIASSALSHRAQQTRQDDGPMNPFAPDGNVVKSFVRCDFGTIEEGAKTIA